MRYSFPDEGNRLVYSADGFGRALRGAQGTTFVVYADEAGTTLADIRTTEGVIIVGSTVAIDEDSLMPRFLGPEGAVFLWVRQEHGIGDTSLVRAAVLPEEIAALVQEIIDQILDGAPNALNTLNELAAALGDDPNFATTVLNYLGRLSTGLLVTANRSLILFDQQFRDLVVTSGVTLTVPHSTVVPWQPGTVIQLTPRSGSFTLAQANAATQDWTVGDTAQGTPYIVSSPTKMVFISNGGGIDTWRLMPGGGGTVSSYVWDEGTHQYREDTDLRIFVGPSTQPPSSSPGGRDQVADVWLDDGEGQPIVTAYVWDEDTEAYESDPDVRIFVGPTDPRVADGGRDNENDIWIPVASDDEVAHSFTAYVWDADGGEYVQGIDARVFVGPEDPVTAPGGRSSYHDVWIAQGVETDDGESPDPSYLFGVGVDDPTVWSAVHPGNAAGDQEFDRAGLHTDIPAGWAWINQAGTYEEKFGAGVLLIPQEAAYQHRFLAKPIPADAVFTITAKVTGSNNNQANSSWGLYVTDGTKVVHLRNSEDAAGSVATYTTLAGAGGANVATQQSRVNLTYFRIRRNSPTSWDFLGSIDGITWRPILLAYNLPAFLVPTHIGFGGYANSAAAQLREIACHWWRVR